jgi:hypothetical protein
MEIESPKRFSFGFSARVKEEAEEKTIQALKRVRSGVDPVSKAIRRGELDADGNFIPSENKPAFAALDVGVDIDIANELLGKYATRGARFNTPKFSKMAPKALYALGFDPIVELVKSFHQITEELDAMRKSKISPIVYTELFKIKNKIASDLARFGYCHASYEADVSKDIVPEVVINLCSEDQLSLSEPLGSIEEDT